MAVDIYKILVRAGFYTAFHFNQKHDLNPPCLIDDQQELEIIGVHKNP